MGDRDKEKSKEEGGDRSARNAGQSGSSNPSQQPGPSGTSNPTQQPGLSGAALSMSLNPGTSNSRTSGIVDGGKKKKERKLPRLQEDEEVDEDESVDPSEGDREANDEDEREGLVKALRRMGIRAPKPFDPKRDRKFETWLDRTEYHLMVTKCPDEDILKAQSSLRHAVPPLNELRRPICRRMSLIISRRYPRHTLSHRLQDCQLHIHKYKFWCHRSYHRWRSPRAHLCRLVTMSLEFRGGRTKEYLLEGSVPLQTQFY